MLKKQIGRFIPYPLILAGRKIVHAGPMRCPVCEGRVRHYLDSGYGYPVLEQLQVVGGMMRRADQCPLCHSSCRERLIWAWLTDFGQRSGPSIASAERDQLRVAHFAPEKGLSVRLKGLAGKSYRAFDFEPARYRHLDNVEQANLMALPLPDESFDLLLCNHVIEHVPDPVVALGELHRILSPGGVAILQVPIALKLEESIELGVDSNPKERIDRAGQDDHLRLYCGPDYRSKLASAGFSVEPFDAFEVHADNATAWMLDPLEVLLICRKTS